MPVAQLTGNHQEDSETSRTFVLAGEGHTLGNALRLVVSSNPNVQFCGYTVPHPSENKMNFRIQMHKGKAVDAFKKGLEDLIKICDITTEQFDKALNEYSNSESSASQ